MGKQNMIDYARKNFPDSPLLKSNQSDSSVSTTTVISVVHVPKLQTSEKQKMPVMIKHL